MYADARLSAAMDSMVRGIATPPVPMTAIRDRLTRPIEAAAARRKPAVRYGLAAAAAIAIFFAIFPKTSLAVIERFEHFVVDSRAAAYKVLGWTPPSAPPANLDRGTASQPVTLAEAQANVAFTIVVPSGVPSDATLASIHVVPSLVYDYATKAWSKGTPAIDFHYRRSHDREFDVMAEEDDPRTGPPSKYMYFGQDLPGGKVELVKHAHFAWKNGKQLTSATEDDGISAQEIAAIRAAMHGQPVIHNPKESIVRRYRVR